MTVSLMCDFCLLVCLFYLTAAESSEKSPVSFVVARNIKWRPTSSVTALLGEELKFQNDPSNLVSHPDLPQLSGRIWVRDY